MHDDHGCSGGVTAFVDDVSLCLQQGDDDPDDITGCSDMGSAYIPPLDATTLFVHEDEVATDTDDGNLSVIVLKGHQGLRGGVESLEAVVQYLADKLHQAPVYLGEVHACYVKWVDVTDEGGFEGDHVIIHCHLDGVFAGTQRRAMVCEVHLDRLNSALSDAHDRTSILEQVTHQENDVRARELGIIIIIADRQR